MVSLVSIATPRLRHSARRSSPQKRPVFAGPIRALPQSRQQDAA
jgi:hypothetical protein